MLFPLERYSDLAGLRKRVLYLSRLCAIIGNLTGDCRFDEISYDQFEKAFSELTCGLGGATRSAVGRYAIEVSKHAERQNTPRGFNLVSNERIRKLAAGNHGLLPERPVTSQQDFYGKYQPLPDAYVAEAGRIWTYYARHVLPNFARLIPLMLADVDVSRRRSWGKRSGALTAARIKQIRLENYRAILQSFIWTDADGKPILELPCFTRTEFPPQAFKGYLQLLSFVQASVMQLLALLTGGRLNEIESLKRDCHNAGPVGDDEMPTIRGATYKFSGLSVGDRKIWPVPALVAEAILEMKKIGDLVMPDWEWLWVGTNSARAFQDVAGCYPGFTGFPRNHKLER